MYDHYGPPAPYHSYNAYRPRRVRGYGLSNLVGDLTLIGLTGGLWILRILYREIRLASG